MASESTDEETVTVSLPPDLDRWLDERADALDIDREAVLEQLLASYRATVETDGAPAVADSEAVDERIDDAVEDALEGRVDAAVGEALEERIEGEIANATADVERQLGERVDALEADYTQNLEDVRERVVQLKLELDEKAAADHTHEELARVDDLSESVENLDAEVETLETRLEEATAEHEDELAAFRESIEEEVEELNERLQTVAWVVSDLREAHEKNTGLDAVERIKRAAAQMDVDRAKCENCGEGVDVALMTDPECPHCMATVTDIQAANGFFGKPQLLVASQLESGERR